QQHDAPGIRSVGNEMGDAMSQCVGLTRTSPSYDKKWRWPSRKQRTAVIYTAALSGVPIGKTRDRHAANKAVGCQKYYEGSAERRPFGLSAAPASARKEGGLP